MEEIVAVGLGTRVIGEATLQKLPFGGPVKGLKSSVFHLLELGLVLTISKCQSLN